MGLGRILDCVLPTTNRNHWIECPACGRYFRTQALYEEHYYQEHSDTRFN